VPTFDTIGRSHAGSRLGVASNHPVAFRARATNPTILANDTLRILIVDDEVSVGRALRRLLRRFDMECTAVSSAAAGLEQLAGDEAFDVVVTDQRMPQMTGTDMLRKIRAENPQILRILMTGWMDETELEAAQEEGLIELLLAKPWVDEDIRRVVDWIRENLRSRPTA